MRVREEMEREAEALGSENIALNLLRAGKIALSEILQRVEELARTVR